MAESDLVAPIFRWAYGWLSDDIFTGIDTSFYSSKNIDIRGNAKAISLNKALVLDSSTTITEKINAIFKTSTGKMVAFGASGWIYWKNTTTWAKITTDSPATTIYSACEFNWYIYWTTVDYLHRLAVWNLSWDITWSDAINRQSITSAVYHPLLPSMWDMFVWHWGKLWKVWIENVWEDLITMDSVWVVKELNDLGGSIRVVTIGSVWNSNIYLRDGTNTNPDQTIPLKWFDIRQSTIFNWYNYLVTNKGLWILDWYKIYPIKKIDWFNDNINSISVFNEKLYIWWTGWVYCYGTKNKNYPEVLNFELSSSNGNSADVIGAMYSDWVNFYVSWSNWSSYGIDKLSTTTYYTTGELVSKWYYANTLYEIKETIRAIVWFSKLKEWESVKVSYSTDWGAYTEIEEIDYDTVLWDLRTEDLIFASWSFQYIQFKIELWCNGTTTPSFYNFNLIFNSIKR